MHECHIVSVISTLLRVSSREVASPSPAPQWRQGDCALGDTYDAFPVNP